jgi:hypothetical protein
MVANLCKPESPATVAAILERHVSEGLTDKGVAHAFGVHESTARRYRLGITAPTEREINRALRKLPASAADDLLTALTRGTPYEFTRVDLDAIEMDFNGDGAIDADDVLDLGIGLLGSDHINLEELRSACRDGRVTQAEATSLISRFNEMRRMAGDAIRVLQQCAK